jgi:chromosome segregation ATPase
LHETKKKLAEQEERVKSYKMTFMGELPQQMEANLNMLRGLQDRFRTNADSIRSAEDRKVFLEAQIGSLERIVQTVVREDGQVDQVLVQDPAQALLTELATRRAQLSDLSARYTDRYPEVQRLRREVDQLEKRIGDVRKSPGSQVDNGYQRIPSSVGTGGIPDTRQREEIAR